MHDNLVLIESGVGGLVDDVIDDGLIVGSSVEQPEAVESTSVGVVVDAISSVTLRQELRKMLPLMSVLEDQAERGDGRELVPVGALARPFQVLLHLEELVVLGEGLEHRQAKNSSAVGDRVLALDLLEVAQVMRVGSPMRLQDKVVDPTGEIPTDNISQHFPLSL